MKFFEDRGIEEILRAICQCITVLHTNGFIHGNIKPSNILINEENEFCLSDSFSFFLRRLTMMGMDEILSEEMILSEEISGKSDMWSIGCLI